MNRRRRGASLVLLACMAVATAAWAAWSPIAAQSREQVYVIPKGTWAKRSAGNMVEVLPAEIRLTIGVKDVLVLRNDDDVPQMFGPVLIMPGQAFQLPFRMASSYQFACSLHASGQLDVIVEPEPAPGWSRLRWRTAAIVKRVTLL